MKTARQFYFSRRRARSLPCSQASNLARSFSCSLAFGFACSLALGFAGGFVGNSGASFAMPPTSPIVPTTLDITGAVNAKLIDTIDANDQLKVKIYRHKINAVSKHPEAWTYVTQGLNRFGQQEIVLTVLLRKADADKDYPPLPIKLFDSIGQLAAQQKIVTVGGYTEFRHNGFLGEQFKGLLYAPVPELLGVPLPENSIAMVPITGEEIEVYQTAGASRLMARLGRQANYFPCATWCDRDRVTCFSEAEIAEMKEDPVFRTAKAQTFSLTAIQNHGALSLRLTDKSAALLHGLLEELPPDSALRLALGVDPRADALLVWESKANGNNSMIAPEGSKYKTIGMTFIALLPGLIKDEILTGNDGCALMLTRDDYDKFKAALETKKSLDLPMSENSALRSFSLEWAAD